MDVTGERRSVREQPLAAILWRGRYLIGLATLAAVFVAAFMTITATKVYEATAVLQARSDPTALAISDPLTLQQASQGAASTYARLLNDRSVMAEIQPNVFDGGLSVSELQLRTSARAVPETSLIELSAEAPTVSEARALAASVVRGFVGVTRAATSERSRDVQRQLQQRISQLTKQIQSLSSRKQPPLEQLTSLRAARASLNDRLSVEVASGIEQSSRIGLVAPPAASDAPIRPRKMVNLVGGVLLGLLLGMGLVILRARLDTGLHGSREVGEALGAPTLASIPVVERPEASAHAAEAYEVARINLMFVSADQPLGVLAVTSFSSGEGKSSTAALLGRAEARSGKSVLLIDGDLRTRQLSQRFAVGDNPGLSTLLARGTPGTNPNVSIEPNLHVLPAGPAPPDPARLLASPRMRELLKKLRSEYDLIIIDSPPVAHLADASILGGLADGIIAVARVGLTKQSHLAELDMQLRNIPRPVVGVIVIEARSFEHNYPLSDVNSSSGNGGPAAAPRRPRASGRTGSTR